MRTLFFLASLTLAGLWSTSELGAAVPLGTITGRVVDQANSQPVQYVTVTVQDPAGKALATGATDVSGNFSLNQIPFGEVRLSYATLGGEVQQSGPLVISASRPLVNAGDLTLTSGAVKMANFEVKTNQAAILNSIDRKVYNVGKDLQSTTGSASALLQNVPSVQVDIDGNVSLRGNQNVLILIDGKPSALMSAANRGDVLEQLPADSIDKVEVITNPSAKYKPDGTAGIINLTLKRSRTPGYFGSIRSSVGNDRRYNLSFSGNYRPGKYNLSTLLSVRQDDRLRFSASLQYNFRTFFRDTTTNNLTRDASGAVTQDYDRFRTDPEWQKTQSVESGWQHTFEGEGHELSFDVKRERHWEQESNHYRNVYRTPTAPTSMESTVLKPTDTTTEFSTAYSRLLKDESKLEAGYTGDADTYETDFRSGFLDPATNTWMLDASRTNRFRYEDRIHALYGTYARTVGKLGFLAGVRLEQTDIDTNQITARLVDHTSYFKFHPSLHLTYSLSDSHQLQLNYSHRIRRPESDDLNPFPEYQDPFNLRAGNPRLLPAETHSIEAGYQYRKDDTTYQTAVYFRNTYHSFTQVTRYIDSTTLLTTQENLATNQSSGLEVTASRPIGPATVNLSGNAYRNQIDASNLGFSSRRSTLTWEAKLNVNYRVTKTTQAELNSNYTAKRLTAQGERLPTSIVNFGLKHDLPDKKTSLILTVSDLFDSLKERTIIDTPTLHDDTTRRRSSRIVYLGVIYNFAKSSKKPKEEGLKYDTAL